MSRPGPARIDLTNPVPPGSTTCPCCGGRPHEAPDLDDAAELFAAAHEALEDPQSD